MKLLAKNAARIFSSLFLPLWAVVLGGNSVFAASTYVGEKILPQDTFVARFFDAPTKSKNNLGDGNVASISLDLSQLRSDTLGWNAGLPVYTVSKEASGLQRDTNIGNVNLGLNWVQTGDQALKDAQFGYGFSADLYLPTARQPESAAVSYVNPTTDFYRFAPNATTINPKLGLFVQRLYWSAKTNVGYGYQYISKDSIALGKKGRNSFQWQLAGSIHPISFLDVNLEYNTIYFDSKTAKSRGQFRQSITPAVAASFAPVTADLFLTIPVDNASRDASSMAFGLQVGYVF